MFPKQDLCEELFKLSGWEEDTFDWWGENKTYLAPRYSLGFILRKLPRRFTIAFDLFDDKTVIDVYYGQDDQDGIHKIEADTPEDCVAKLAIALFQQGILKRKGEK